MNPPLQASPEALSLLVEATFWRPAARPRGENLDDSELAICSGLSVLDTAGRAQRPRPFPTPPRSLPSRSPSRCSRTASRSAGSRPPTSPSTKGRQPDHRLRGRRPRSPARGRKPATCPPPPGATSCSSSTSPSPSPSRSSRRGRRPEACPSLHPADLVAVATYAASSGSELVLGFTSDRGQVDIDLGLPQLVDRNVNDPLRLILQRGAAAGQRRAPGTKATPDTPMDRPTPSVSRRAPAAGGPRGKGAGRARDGPSDLESQTREVTALTRSFADLARIMGSVQGRKYVVYLSEGFDSRAPPGHPRQASRTRWPRRGLGRVLELSSEERYGSTKP